MKFNPKAHIIGKVYDLTQENMNALISEFEVLDKTNRILESENARLREALESIEQQAEQGHKESH